MKGLAFIPPETRRKLIEILAMELSYRQLAYSLGVTPPAIYKYLSGKATPRDTVVEKALVLAADLGIDDIGDEIINDIATELEELIKILVNLNLIAPGSLSRLSDIIMRAKLVLASMSPRTM